MTSVERTISKAKRRAELAVAFNDGLERGRKQQTLGGGYLVPATIYSRADDYRKAYLAGWDAGYEKTTPIHLLRKPVVR